MFLRLLQQGPDQIDISRDTRRSPQRRPDDGEVGEAATVPRRKRGFSSALETGERESMRTMRTSTPRNFSGLYNSYYLGHVPFRRKGWNGVVGWGCGSRELARERAMYTARNITRKREGIGCSCWNRCCWAGARFVGGFAIRRWVGEGALGDGWDQDRRRREWL